MKKAGVVGNNGIGNFHNSNNTTCNTINFISNNSDINVGGNTNNNKAFVGKKNNH